MDHHQQADAATDPTTRRHFLASTGATALSVTALNVALGDGPSTQSGQAKVTVGGHPWVYAATQPKYDITPVLPTAVAQVVGKDGG